MKENILKKYEIVLLRFTTILSLKPSQIIHQILFKLKKLYNPILPKIHIYSPVKLGLCIKPTTDECILRKRKFTFINHTVNYRNSILWNDPHQEKLWLYNLHYFEYLLPLCKNHSIDNYNEAKLFTEDWINNNPIGDGNGWEPYPISLRLTNWNFFYDTYHNEFEKDPEFKSLFLYSLNVQYLHLGKRIEYHLQANHLFANLKAMLFTALYLRDSKGIRKYTKQILEQINEQIDDNGGHYEKSPLYHCIILTDLLDILNLLTAQSKNTEGQIYTYLIDLKDNHIEPAVNNMLLWIIAMKQPDNEIPLLGDSAFNIAPKINDIVGYYEAISGKEYKHQTQSGLTNLMGSGYHIFRTETQYLVFDTGQLGVSYQPGHVHCDILSFEYSFNKKRFIVDSGVGNYLDSDLRRMCRSIYAHNTVVVKDQDQAQLWKAFRIGKRVNKVWSLTGSDRVTGYYTNNISRKNSYTHSRQIKIVENEYFLIEDQITSHKINSLKFLFHFHPDVIVNKRENSVLLAINDDKVVLEWFEPMKYALQDSVYVPEFGKILNSKVLVLQAVNFHNTYNFKINPDI